MRREALLLAAIGLLLLWAPLLAADDSTLIAPTFKGVQSCKICHKADKIYPTWEETAHAGAFNSLPEDQRTNETCLECHATGVNEKGEVLEGVQCEACHGPGSAYSPKSVMEDRAKAIAAGLVIPDQHTCVRCHTDELPKACGVPMQENFAFDLMKIKGVHALKIHDMPSDSVDVPEGE